MQRRTGPFVNEMKNSKLIGRQDSLRHIITSVTNNAQRAKPSRIRGWELVNPRRLAPENQTRLRICEEMSWTKIIH
jgi:hypothetical protein